MSVPGEPSRLRGFRAGAVEPVPLADEPPPVSSGQPRRTGWQWPAAVAGVAVVAVVVTAVLAFRLGATGSDANDANPTPPPSISATPTTLEVTDIYRRVLPSIVVVTTADGSLGSGFVVTGTAPS